MDTFGRVGDRLEASGPRVAMDTFGRAHRFVRPTSMQST